MMEGGIAQQAPLGSQNKFAPNASYTPEQYDSALVHLARSQSLEAITLANANHDGHLLAWESTISFAETLMPMAGQSFLTYYTQLRKSASRNSGYPARALWRICSLEAKRQKRLGSESVPINRLTLGVSPQ